MKAIKHLFFALAIVAGTTSAWAETINGINYNLDPSSLTATVGANSGVSGAITIPVTVSDEYLLTYTVTGIEDYAFYNCTGLTSVTFETGSQLTSIENDAFSGCSGLTSIDIPDGVTSIGEAAFYNCSSLGTVTFAAGSQLTGIGNAAFGKCSALTSITIPAGVTGIAFDTFANCNSLASVTIPAGVNSIDDYAFTNCTNLTDMTVNWSGLTGVTVELEAFYGVTTSNVNLHVPAGTYTTYVAAAPWNSFNIIDPYGGQCGDNLTWEYNPSNTTLTITGSGDMYDYEYNTIPWKDYRSSITTVSLPNEITHIGNRAFQNCSHLASINIPSSVETIGEYALFYCSALTSVTLPDGLISIGKNAFSHSGLTSITIPSSVTSIGVWAFDECPGLTSITFAEGSHLTSIGEKAFYGCPSGLTTIDIPSSVTSLGIRAFASCSGLADVTVHWDTPLTISSNTFDGIASPSTLHVPYGTKDAYEAATGWNNFNNIVEMNPGGQCGDNLLWEYDLSTTTLTISGTGAMTNYNNYSFLAPWNTYKDEMTTVVIESGATTIGKNAFYQCTALSSVTIPNSVTSIGNSAFDKCSGLTEITIPASVTSIGEYAFYQCTSLGAIVIPTGVTSIERSVFSQCSSLTSVTIPAGVTGIGEAAFQDCSSLTSVTIPVGVTSINTYAFYQCSGMTSITVEDGNTVYDSRNNCNAIIETASNKLIVGCRNTVIPNTVTSIGDYAFKKCVSLPSVTFPNSLTSIGKQAFYQCSSLPSITIPEGVTRLGTQAFQECNNLTDIYVSWTNPSSVTMEFDVFSGLTLANINLHVPAGTKSTYLALYAWKDFNIIDPYSGTCGTKLTWVYNPSTTTLTISGTGSMTNYTTSSLAPWNTYKDEITTVVIENGATSIGDNAFQLCSALTSITIPASVTRINSGAFYKCSALTSINIPGTVNGIGVSAFNECSGLTSVTIQQGVKTIGQNAFYKCSALTSCTVPNSVTGIGNHAFTQCSAMTSLSIGSGATTIGTITHCPSLTSISIDANNTVYDSRENCNAIIKKSNNTLIAGCKNTVIPAGVTSIGESAFYGSTGLTEITIPSSVTSIGNTAFYDCTNLASVNIPAGVTSIGTFAFYKCSALTSLDIPTSVTSIGNYAFQGCTGLKNVYVNWMDLSDVTLYSNIFTLVTTSKINLHVPFAAWELYETAAPWNGFKQVPMVNAKADPNNANTYYNTFYHSTIAYELPTGVKAYKAKRNGGDLELTKVAEAGDVLPAGAAVILKSSVASYELVPSDAGTVTVEDNDLQGVDVATPVATVVTSGTCYVLSGPNPSNTEITEVGFYTFSATLGAHKAYVVIPGASSAPQHLRFVFGTTTDIESPSLQGRSGEASKILRDGVLYIKRGEHIYNANGQMIK